MQTSRSLELKNLVEADQKEREYWEVMADDKAVKLRFGLTRDPDEGSLAVSFYSVYNCFHGPVI